MGRIPSDEQLDTMIARLLADASAAEQETDEIADSPALWRSIKRDIARGQAGIKTPWPPVKLWRWFALPSLATAALILLWFALPGTRYEPDVARSQTTTDTLGVSGASKIVTNSIITPDARRPEPNPDASNMRTTIQRKPAQVSLVRPAPSRLAAPLTAKTTKRNGAEVKSDFIAMSLGPRPTSGQILKLRVPSSLMVTLGLVESVEKPSAMVNAEVLMGDDGTTHSIRFIR